MTSLDISLTHKSPLSCPFGYNALRFRSVLLLQQCLASRQPDACFGTFLSLCFVCFLSSTLPFFFAFFLSFFRSYFLPVSAAFLFSSHSSDLSFPSSTFARHEGEEGRQGYRHPFSISALEAGKS